MNGEGKYWVGAAEGAAGNVGIVNVQESMASFSEALLIAACLLPILIRGGDGSSVRWAVKVRGDDNSPEERARELAGEHGLLFVGRVDPFPDVFELELPHELIQARSIGQMDVQFVEDTVHNDLTDHPDIKWASKQVALIRRKREFSDPAFIKQWHLVWIVYKLQQCLITCPPQVNRQEMGHDTNVSGVWREGVNGAGVTVAVVDDGQYYILCAVIMFPCQLLV